MINASDNGMATAVKIEGELSEILEELTGILISMRQMLEDKYGKREAEEIIAICGKVAFADKAHIESAQDEMVDYLESMLSEKG